MGITYSQVTFNLIMKLLVFSSLLVVMAFSIGMTNFIDATSESFTVLVPDFDLRPVFSSFPADIVTEATAILTPVTIGNATATHISGIPPIITNNSTGLFQYGHTTIQWSATDGFGNTTIKNQSITIIDTTPPLLTVPDDVVSFENFIVGRGNATATDIFPVTITNDDASTLVHLGEGPSYRIYPSGNTTIIWSATDVNGNITNGTQIISITNIIDGGFTPQKPSGPVPGGAPIDPIGVLPP